MNHSHLVDRGAVFAGWVGFGMALLVAISFELVVAVQSLVFLFAPIGGLLIGYYANARSERRRPWWRVLTNAGYAAAVTGISLALLYGLIRLVFIYGDTGYRDPGQGGPLQCARGPECTYGRYLAAGRVAELEAAGVRDAESFEAYLLREQLSGALVLSGLTLVGGLAGGAMHGLAGSTGSTSSGYPSPETA